MARKVVFVDTDRPSGACYSKLDDSIYTGYVEGGIPSFFDIGLPNEKWFTGFWTQGKRISPLRMLQLSYVTAMTFFNK